MVANGEFKLSISSNLHVLAHIQSSRTGTCTLESRVSIPPGCFTHIALVYCESSAPSQLSAAGSVARGSHASRRLAIFINGVLDSETSVDPSAPEVASVEVTSTIGGHLFPLLFGAAPVPWTAGTAGSDTRGCSGGCSPDVDVLGAANLVGARAESSALGRRGWRADELFKGVIAEVRLWAVERLPSDLAASFRLALSGAEPDLRGYWPLVGRQRYLAGKLIK